MLAALRWAFRPGEMNMLALNAWAVEHAALSISVGSVGDDGLTPYSRWSGKKWGRPWAAFGSAVWASSGGAWLQGVLVGSRADSQEAAVVCGGSLHYTRDLKSAVEADWWLDELRRGRSTTAGARGRN